MLRKDLQMAILLGKRHLNYFTQLSDPKKDQILSSQIRMFEKKLIVQFAPYRKSLTISSDNFLLKLIKNIFVFN